MESRFCSCWIFLWTFIILFRDIAAEPASPHYTIRHTRVTFDQAMDKCSPGTLTTLATKQEVATILRLISESVSVLDQNAFTFWVGLRKVKNECVVPTLPLRGFKWTEDGSDESQVSRWTAEPKHTCATVRCAALKVELDGSTVTTWGLIPVTCKNSSQFICKLRDTPKPVTPEQEPAPPESKLATPEPEPATPEPKPATPEPEPGTPEPKPATPEPEPATPEPKPATPEPEPGTPEPKPTEAELHKPELRPATPELTASEPGLPTQKTEPDTKTGSELHRADSESGSVSALELDSCQNPVISGARFLSLDPVNTTRIQVECWSNIQVELHCSGHPAVWRLQDDSPANFTTICQPCGNGFQKDASGNCMDIDECSNGAACGVSCLNTEGSYRCVCFDENGKHYDEDSSVCMEITETDNNSLLSGILIPVLVALVVLVVVVTVTVKCCLMRHSKKRAMKKAEKMAMKSKDDKVSFETANEKVAK